MRTLCISLAICCGLFAVSVSARQASSASPASSSCTATSRNKEQRYDTGTFAKPAPGTSLRGAMVYVYSFLDVRTDEMGSRLVEQFNKQVVQMLSGADVQTKFLAFRDSEAAGQGLYSQKEHPSDLLPDLTDTSTSVPVQAVVAANAAMEKAADAKYRLILFPNYMSEVAYWRSLDIRWTLIDVKTDKIIWVFSTTIRSIGYGKPDNNAQNRVASNMKKAMESLRQYRLIN